MIILIPLLQLLTGIEVVRGIKLQLASHGYVRVPCTVARRDLIVVPGRQGHVRPLPGC